MQFMARLVSLAATVLVALICLATPAAAAGPVSTCTANLTIFTTSPGTVTTAGPVTVYRDSGVGGSYSSGVLQGSAITGSQDIVLNTLTGQSYLVGTLTASGPNGTLTLRYTGQADLTSGQATGQFVSVGGTGQFAAFHWSGTITARLIGPATFAATDTGPCFQAP